jgi:hypothetical protein
MLGTARGLARRASLSYELFFGGSVIGLRVILERTAPINLRPVWRRRLRWLILPALLVFTYIVIRRILAILPEGVV